MKSIGQLLHAFAGAHDDQVAPTLWASDSQWSTNPPNGWDVSIGRWGNASHGAMKMWRCTEQRTAYVGNARAFGTDSTTSSTQGRRWVVSRSRWNRPAKLVIAYDIQYNILDTVHPNATAEEVGDISDEYHEWPNAEPFTLGFWMPDWGPHNEAFGVLFGDGHAEIARYPDWSRAELWSGLPWWPSSFRALPLSHKRDASGGSQQFDGSPSN